MNAINHRGQVGRVVTRVRRVVDEGGMVTDEAADRRLVEEATVATLMSRTTYCVRPEVPIETVIGLLLENRMSGVPVIDDDGRPVGVITKTDLLRHLHETGDGVDALDAAHRRIEASLGGGYHPTAIHGASVRDVMMPVVFAVDADASIPLAAALMAGEGIHRLPVVGPEGTVVGLLSSLDVCRWVAEAAGYVV